MYTSHHHHHHQIEGHSCMYQEWSSASTSRASSGLAAKISINELAHLVETRTSGERISSVLVREADTPSCIQEVSVSGWTRYTVQ